MRLESPFERQRFLDEREEWQLPCLTRRETDIAKICIVFAVTASVRVPLHSALMRAVPEGCVPAMKMRAVEGGRFVGRQLSAVSHQLIAIKHQ